MMPTVLIIDDDQDARAYVREMAPADWTFLEAGDGLSGVDLVRQHYRELDLVVLDLQLPHLNGRSTCVRIRDIRADLPILPFTGYSSQATVLGTYGCLDPIFKPTAPHVLAAGLRAALQQSMPPVNTTPLATLVREQSEQLEQLLRRQQLDLRVAVYIESPMKRSGLTQTLAPFAQVRAAWNLAELDLFLRRSTWTAIIADAGALPDILAMSGSQRVPIIALAADSAEARTIDTASVTAVLVEHDPALQARIRDVIAALAAGERPEPLILPADLDPGERHVVPPRIVRLFDATELSLRELDIVWLHYQGMSSKEIARRLRLAEPTIGSHWRNIARKLKLSRSAAEAWTRVRIAESAP